uniref:Uncharacterized protein n=1 Tax=Hyaloperonospora arabidopsidis (strain Emoy2) TaxID=559515 RepID=M4B3J2_HYAAE
MNSRRDSRSYCYCILEVDDAYYMSSFLPEFLTYQKRAVVAGDRELNELLQLSEKQMDAKTRELENWNFRLNLDEARETQDSIRLGIVERKLQ